MVASLFRDELTRWMTPEQSLLSRRLAGRRLFEVLESRTLLSSTLFVTAPPPLGVPTDGTHFQTLQAALQAAAAGDVIDLQNGFMSGTFTTTSLTQAAVAGAMSIRTAGALEVGDVVTVGNNVGGDIAERVLVTGVTLLGTGDYQIALATPLLLAHAGSMVDATGGAMGPTIGIAKGITLTADAGVVLPFNLEIWQTGASSLITLSHLNMGTHTLQVDGNGSTISDCTLSHVVVMAGAQGNAFVHNTFNVASGDGLSLESAGGTRLDSNTFNVTAAAAFGVVVHNSAGVVLVNNVVKTGSGGTGIYVAVDDGQAAAVDLRGNVVQTTDGYGIYVAKLSTGSSLQVRVQGNDLRQNAVGMLILGDGSSAGNVDVGGGLTVFGSGTGGNDFSGFGSDESHFAMGLFNTGANYYVRALGNVFTAFNPLGLMADATHTVEAGGTGMIVASGGPGFDYVTAKMTLTVVESSAGGNVASFTTFLSHVAWDFAALIDWGDGAVTFGAVTDNGSGGFHVTGGHTWSAAGTFTVTVVIESMSGGVALVAAPATVNPRMLAVQGMSIVADQTEIFSGPVARFTDSKAGTPAADFVASITWSDGQTTAGLVSQNADGSFSVNTSRAFNQAGGLTASVSVATADSLYQAAGSVNATVNARLLAATGFDFTLDAGTTFNDVVASFADTRLGTSTGDYVASVAWSDGMTTAGVITRSADGTFTVSTSRTFSSQGVVSGTVSLATTDGLITAVANVTATVAVPRVLLLEGVNFSSDKKTPFSGVVARFTDSLAGTTAASYVASVAWSDGMITNATIKKNADGSFSISTARSFTKAGVLVASVAVGTVDGAFGATASFTATITNNGKKVPHAMKMVVRLIRHDLQRQAHGRQLAWGHCGR